jgi:hypothetical protein
VVAVGESEPKEDAARRLEPQGVDELLAHQAHRGGAQDDDPLLVRPDDALIGAEVEQLGEMQIVARRVSAWRGRPFTTPPSYMAGTARDCPVSRPLAATPGPKPDEG